MNSFLLLCDVFLFVFWKKLKTPKRHFKINRPLGKGQEEFNPNFNSKPDNGCQIEKSGTPE